MSEMIDRVARAMCIADGMDPDHLPNEDYADGHEVQWMLYRNMAKAAIKAMREPTEAMVEASNREWDGRMSHRSSGAWQAMIDAALNPPANT